MTVEEFRDVVAAWHVGEKSAADIVSAACDLVLAGIDGPAVCMLAGASPRHAHDEVLLLLEDALLELGLDHHEHHGDGAKVEGLRWKARLTLSGELPPHELTHWARFTFFQSLPEAGTLVDLSYRYRYFDHFGQSLDGLTLSELDERVLAEARRLTA